MINCSAMIHLLDETSVNYGKLLTTDSRRPTVKSKTGVNVYNASEQCERKSLAHSREWEEVESAASQENKTVRSFLHRNYRWS